MWQKLMAARIEKVVLPAAWAGLKVAVASLLKKGSSGSACQFAAFPWCSLSLILDRLNQCQLQARGARSLRAHKRHRCSWDPQGPYLLTVEPLAPLQPDEPRRRNAVVHGDRPAGGLRTFRVAVLAGA